MLHRYRHVHNPDIDNADDTLESSVIFWAFPKAIVYFCGLMLIAQPLFFVDNVHAGGVKKELHQSVFEWKMFFHPHYPQLFLAVLFDPNEAITFDWYNVDVGLNLIQEHKNYPVHQSCLAPGLLLL